MEKISTFVELRALQLDDQKRLAELANNQEIWKNVRDSFPHPYSQYDARMFIHLVAKEKPNVTFGIFNDSELTGVAGVTMRSDIYRHTAELGYWVGRPYWGRGIATEAVRQLSAYAFRDLRLLKLFSGIIEYNRASMRVLEKNGFYQEAILKMNICKQDKFYDEYRYAKLNPSLSREMSPR